jgi:hypothetical protein
MILLGGLGLISAAVLAAMSPIVQDQAYHAFADTRRLLGIPNVWNVVSNLLFVAVGAAGVALLRKDAAATALFVGILLTGLRLVLLSPRSRRRHAVLGPAADDDRLHGPCSPAPSASASAKPPAATRCGRCWRSGLRA